LILGYISKNYNNYSYIFAKDPINYFNYDIKISKVFDFISFFTYPPTEFIFI